MRMKHLIVSALVLALVPVAGPAAADIAPPRIHIEKPKPSRALQDTFVRFEKALREKDEAAAKAEIDSRGWDDNLVGGSGTALSSLVSQGMRKGWYLRAKWGSFRKFGTAVVVAADIVQIAGGEVSDEAFFVLVEDAGRWRFLGGGESWDEARGLADRVRLKRPLAPPASPTKDAP